MGSGLIYAVILGAWVVVGIQYLARRHEESSESRSIDRFSNAMRVLSRRGPKKSAASRYVVMPPREPVVEVTVSGPATPKPVGAAAPVPARTTARVARRRRSGLYGILLATIVVSVAVGMSRLPWWSIPAAVFVLIGYLFHLRSQVRTGAERGSARRPARRQVRPAAAPVGTPATGPLRDREPQSHPAQAGAADGDEPADGTGEVWSPMPIHVPTYVSKPKATRAARTIDLTRPGAWSQGISIQIQRPPQAERVAAWPEAQDPEPEGEQLFEPAPDEVPAEQVERPRAVND